MSRLITVAAEVITSMPDMATVVMITVIDVATIVLHDVALRQVNQGFPSGARARAS